MVSLEDAVASLPHMTDLPSVERITGIAQRCRKERNKSYARQVHSHVCDKGLEVHDAVGRHLVHMFAECGSIVVAQQVFNRLKYHSEFSWTALMQGYIDHGDSQIAFSLYQTMRDECICPSKYTFMVLLKACTRLKFMDEGQKLHSEIVKEGLEGDHFIGSTLVVMYAKCNFLKDAHEVLNELPMRDAISWTALIAGYADRGHGQEAWECFQQMQSEGVTPDRVTYVCSLKACGSIKAIDKGRKVHAEVAQKGLMKDPSICNALVGMYIKCGSFELAREVFDKLPIRDVGSWNILMMGYLEQDLAREVLDCFKKMRLECVSPDGMSYLCSLKACGSIGAIKRGQEIHAEIDRRGFKLDPFVGSALVDMYAKCGSLDKAQEAFDELPVKEVVSWTALITGYTENGMSKEALGCLETMQQEGITPDSVTFVCGLKACGTIGALCNGQEIHAEVVKKGFEGDNCLDSSLVDMYAKCGSLTDAQHLFNNLQRKDTVSWTSLVAGYAEHGLGEEAWNAFQQMQLEGLPLDDVTFVCGLKACGSMEAISRGFEVHAEVVKAGYERDKFVGSSLVDMYAKHGLLGEAQECLDVCPVRDAVTWTALIAGYAEQGLGEVALDCYQQMQFEGVSPNAITHVCTLKVCGSMGAISKGQEIHTEVIKEGYEVADFVGSNLVDMYARCGSHVDARDVLLKLPFLDATAWNALIAGYIEHGLGEEAFECFSQMQSKGSFPDVITFITGLRACASTRLVDGGRQLHSEIVKAGCESDHFVGSTLVDMYANAGSFAEATYIFDKLSARDVVSWNSLITGYVEHDLKEEVFACLEQMQSQGVSPTPITYACLLKVIRSLDEVSSCHEMHHEIVIRGYDRDSHIESNLIAMYASCALFAEAHEVREKLLVQDVISWNTLIASYAEYGLGEEALCCFEKMNVPPNAGTFVHSLKACGIIADVKRVQRIHTEIVMQEYEKDDFVGSILVDTYADCGFLLDARDVLEELPVRDVVSWTALVAKYADQGYSEETFECFREMQLEGTSPDIVTMSCLLRACSVLGSTDKAREVHAELLKMGYEKGPNIGRDLVKMYVKCGSMVEAQAVFEDFPIKDASLWTALISGLAEQGFSMEVLKFVDYMQSEGVFLDSAIVVCILKASSVVGAIERVQEIHADVTGRGLETDSFLGNALVGAYAKCDLLTEAQDVFDKLDIRDVVSWTVLIARYGEKGLEKAWDCFQSMQLAGVFPDEVAWNALILGSGEQGSADKAVKVFALMQEQSMLPESTAFVTMLKACGNTAALEVGERIHAQVYRVGPNTMDVTMATAVIDMYGKCGSLAGAQGAFDEIPTHDLVTWNALVTAYTRLGESELVFSTLKRMKEGGIRPDGITFVNALTVCSHMGLVNEGREYFEAMSKEYGIGPSVKHQNCLVDLLGRAGQLDEAVLTVEKMDQPDHVVWNTVLSACRKWGDVELGKQAFEHAADSDESLAGAFVLMSNIYADTHLEENQSIESMEKGVLQCPP